MPEFDAIARLIDGLRPWLGRVVLVGGWAHHLYRFHELAQAPAYRPLRTREADVAFSMAAPLDGDIAAALQVKGFTKELSGEHSPPVTHYTLGGEHGVFYAEFLVPLHGSGYKRSGEPDVSVHKSGITAQKLRYVDLLIEEPWAVRLDESAGVPLTPGAEVRLANPASFLAQKLLIQRYRPANKQAQDALYIHDTLELFGHELETLNTLWKERLRDTLPAKTVEDFERDIHDRFGAVTDVIRSAARIPPDRTLAADRLQQACLVGLESVFLD